MPPGLEATTSTVPVVELDGAVKVTDVDVVDRTVAATPPTVTVVTAPRPVPVATTVVPPVTGPAVGDTDVT